MIAQKSLVYMKYLVLLLESAQVAAKAPYACIEHTADT